MHLRRKISVAAALLLVCAVLLGSVSYAWLTISTAPEISGIDTNIGANGSLEIALLSDETYMDPSLIRSTVGDSLTVEDAVVSNRSWGNIIDLSGLNYGLGEISLRPSRLNVKKDAEGNAIVGTNMLVFPRYGVDGRSNDFHQDSVSAVYSTNEFTYHTKGQSYGVRAIGTVSEMTVQQAALANARSQTYSYTTAAASAAVSAWKVDGADFWDIYRRHYDLDADAFTKNDVAVIRDMAVRIRNAVNYIDLALRQGVVGCAAAVIEDEDAFKFARTSIVNQDVPLVDTIDSYRHFWGANELLSKFSGWAELIRQDKESLNLVVEHCDWQLAHSDRFNWNEIEWMLVRLMNPQYAYWNDGILAEMESISTDNVLTLAEEAGPAAHIADFTGDYKAFFSYEDDSQGAVNVEVATLSATSVPHLALVVGALSELRAAAGDNALTGVPLEDIYGFSVDLAFRCNNITNLLLQTTPEDRTESDDEFSETQGGGSYMEIHSETLSDEQLDRMLDAIRIGFLDHQNKLIALAKCVSYETVAGTAAGHLYLHNFNVTNEGHISIGAPLKYAPAIVTLTDGIPTVITAVVWMDGDYVDNSLVAVSGKSMDGVINLQFASSIDLRPFDAAG